jgi:hypothetical protein
VTKHANVVWNSATGQSFCPRCGRTSGHSNKQAAQAEIEQHECRLPYVETSQKTSDSQPRGHTGQSSAMSPKPERSGTKFSVGRTDDGKPVIRLGLFHDTVSSLNGLSIGFELLSGTTPEQARTLVDSINERVVGIIVALRK